MRIRLTSVSSPGPDGQDGNGEVEDHVVTLATTCASQLAIYNAIISNNLATPSDIQGRSVIKTITGTDSFSTGHLVTGAGTTTLAVQTGFASAGGPINMVNGSLWAPSVAALNGRTVNYPGGGSLLTSPAFDFATVFNSIVAESATYAAMPTNSSISIPTSPAVTYLTVGSGVTNGTPAVFSIDGNTLLHNGNVQTIDLNLNGKTPSAIIINITGTSISYDWSGENINVLRDTTLRSKILWHFPTATSITLGKPLYGSILAPNATLTATGGANEGSVMAKNYTGTIAIKLPLWLGGSSVCSDASDFGDSILFPDASSTAVTTIKMGTNPGDVDTAGLANSTADGDDNNGTDDEDGVTIGTLPQAGTGTITVNVSNSSGAPAYLSGWIDWNNNGVLTDAGEQVIADVNVATGTSASNQIYTVNVPATAVLGAHGARFRFTSTSNAGPTDYSGNGEVEDYLATVTGPNTDFGDFSDFAPASSLISNTLKLGGNAPDGEVAAITNATATGDDTSAQDDEDGVSLPGLMIAGNSHSVTVNVNNTSGSTAYLNAWFDWNNNGILTDAGELMINNVSIANGVTGNQLYTITAPAGATTGNIGARFRFTSTSAPGPTSASGTGEVEDYAVAFGPSDDFGDAPASYGIANHTAASSVGVGLLVDTEASQTSNATATGDDSNGTSDEDGIFADLPLVPGRETAVIINTRGNGFLNAWIDFNRDGDFLDAGEQLATNQVVSANATISPSQASPALLEFTVPATAVPGTSYIRVRMSSTSLASPSGAGGVGEVEDLAVTILSPATVSGRAWADMNSDGIRSGGTEVGVSGMIAILCRIDGKVEATTVTNATGDYQFSALPPGSYFVKLSLPDWVFTQPRTARLRHHAG